MPFRRTNAEPIGKAIEEFRSECNFWHQDRCLSPAANVLGHCLKIDFGFSRSGHAVKKRYRVTALRERGAQRIGGRQLSQREFRFAEIGVRLRGYRLRRQDDGFQRAFIDQSIDDTGADTCFLCRLFFGTDQSIGKKLKQ